MPREQITLACTGCKRRNYRTTANKKLSKEKLEIKKYCRWCGKHVMHRETK